MGNVGGLLIPVSPFYIDVVSWQIICCIWDYFCFSRGWKMILLLWDHFGKLYWSYFISSTSVLDLDRVCILLFFPLLFTDIAIYFSGSEILVLFLNRVILLYENAVWYIEQIGCLFPAKEPISLLICCCLLACFVRFLQVARV